MSGKFSSPFMNKSPLRDAKFNTSLQPSAVDPKRLLNMTEEERTAARAALGDTVVAGVSLNPSLSGATKVVKGGSNFLKAIATGNVGNIIKTNARNVANFLAQKIGLKGSTAATGNISKM
jgi:hypothetical protein